MSRLKKILKAILTFVKKLSIKYAIAILTAANKMAIAYLMERVEFEIDAEELELYIAVRKRIKEKCPVGPLPPPSNFRVQAINPEQLYLIVDADFDAYCYRWELQELDATGQPVGTPIITITIEPCATVSGLTSGKWYSCRVVALGKVSSVLSYSVEVTQIVL